MLTHMTQTVGLFFSVPDRIIEVQTDPSHYSVFIRTKTASVAFQIKGNREEARALQKALRNVGGLRIDTALKLTPKEVSDRALEKT